MRQFSQRSLILVGLSAILLILISVQFFMIGLIGEMVVRVYYEAGTKPIYYIRQVIS
jgi:hypothetical protein